MSNVDIIRIWKEEIFWFFLFCTIYSSFLLSFCDSEVDVFQLYIHIREIT